MIVVLAATTRPPVEPFAQDLPHIESVTIDTAGAVIITSDPHISDATCEISEEPTLIIGDNEDDDSHLFSSIRGAGLLSDGSIAAIDRRAAEVRIFDSSGRHVRSIGRSGRGPAEFQDPFILWITPGDTLWVGDYRPWRYKIFTADGEFVRQVSLKPEYPNPSRGGGVLDNGFTVNASFSWPYTRDFSERESLIMEVHDPDGNRAGGPLVLPGSRMGSIRGGPPNYVQRTLWGANPEIDALGSTIAVAHGSRPEVKLVDHDLSMQLVIRWNEPTRSVRRADVRNWRDNLRERRGENWSEDDEARVSPRCPVADNFPVISDVRIGRDGRIWVNRYNLPDERRGWLGFSTDGSFACHLTETPGYVWEFGSDYVPWESDEGSLTVRKHELKLPL